MENLIINKTQDDSFFVRLSPTGNISENLFKFNPSYNRRDVTILQIVFLKDFCIFELINKN